MFTKGWQGDQRERGSVIGMRKYPGYLSTLLVFLKWSTRDIPSLTSASLNTIENPPHPTDRVKSDLHIKTDRSQPMPLFQTPTLLAFIGGDDQGYCHPRSPGVELAPDAGKRCVGDYEEFRPQCGLDCYSTGCCDGCFRCCQLQQLAQPRAVQPFRRFLSNGEFQCFMIIVSPV